jgi:Domain of unknown function (DUF4604)
MAFNAKNLHYEKQEPAFLRRLRSENTSDRQQVSTARPRNPRLENGDDDEPTIVDEQGETLTQNQYQQLIHGKSEDASVTKDISTITEADPESKTQESGPSRTDEMGNERETRRLTISSVMKKRKQVKAIVAESEAGHLTVEGDLSKAQGDEEPGTKGRKKKKKVKLSFDDLET